MTILSSYYPPKEFNETLYLEANADVAKAIQERIISSGWEHFYYHGFSENRLGVSDKVKELVQESRKRDIILVPPEELHDVGSGDFIQVGDDIFTLLVNIGNLKRDDRVLDVGSGKGRIARPLAQYLTTGTYHGFDIVESSIHWCQKAYGELYPNFHFYYSDVYNKMYNAKGNYQAHEYKFPFSDNSLSFIFLTSVFTHMLPLDMENYLAEISRVLQKNGTCFITFFLLNSDSQKSIDSQMSDFSFAFELEGCRVENLDIPENAVAFNEDKVRELYEKYYLKIEEPIRYGKWSRRNDFVSYQDIIIAKKSN
jgi:ubiquinone/menaquinone biosynthesis C-methylase UbiE